jgi:cytosine/adenosine deaminase-related metal-dependent hydrolase
VNEGVSRRAFIGGAAVAGAGLAGVAAPAGARTGRKKGHEGVGHHPPGKPGRLPKRGEFTIRGAHVLTMDPGLGDIAGGDVHVRNGQIVAVGKGIRGGGERIDGRRTIVMPGLVDTHWHLWTTLHRSLATAGGDPANGYFALNVRHGVASRPEDIYRGVKLSLADALNSGITTVHDWAHNLRGPAYADANLRAHAETGLRGRFSYGTPQGHPATETIDLDDLERVHREWFRSGRIGGLVHLGLAGRPPGTVEPEVYRTEWERARALGLPVSYHANSNRAQGAQAMIQQLGDEGMLGPHVQIIHALFTTAAERALLVDTGTPVSVSPWSELLIGYGVTPIREMAAAGMLLTLSVDTTPLTGTAELFSVMRVTLGLDRGQAEAEFDMTARRVLEMATIDGARGLGIADEVGSLKPGKRADLIMIRTDEINVAPFTDAANLVALAAGPQNVDTVVVDGRILKRAGRLTALDPARIVAEAQRAFEEVRARASSPAATAAAAKARRAAPAAAACCG